MARIGEIIDGKYEIVREIGRGGMSVVYLAMDKRLNKQWAIKEFRKDKDDHDKEVALKSLLDEANIMKKLDHPTLPRIVDIISNSQTAYVVMDYIEGESLKKVLDAYGAQPQEAVVEWGKQLSDVLDYLHTQNPPIIYRDMKPANIMLMPNGSVRLIDFGIAREYKEGKEGDTEAIGTRGYAPPESFGGKGQTDARTDIYSLGVTLYHLVTGKNPAEPPYELYPIRHWNSSLSSGLEWLIQKCTQLNPVDRYQSCAEVTYVLENLERFDVDYKKSLKTKINLFTAMVSLTVVFLLAGVGFLLGGKASKNNSYSALVEQGNNISALEIDSEAPLAYVELAKQLDGISTIVKGEKTNREKFTTEVTSADIDTWFSIENMTNLRENWPKEYVRIQFDLGFLYWEKDYVDENGSLVTKAEKMLETMSYFENVFAVAKNGEITGENGIYGGLTETEYNMAKNYYIVSYFQVNRDKFVQDESGKVADFSGLENLTGFEVDEDNIYSSFWDIYIQVLKDLAVSKKSEISDKAKISTLKMLTYVLAENQENFYNYNISEEKMQDFIDTFYNVLDSIDKSNDQNSKASNEISDEMLKTVKQIGGLYEFEFKTGGGK